MRLVHSIDDLVALLTRDFAASLGRHVGVDQVVGMVPEFHIYGHCNPITGGMTGMQFPALCVETNYGQPTRIMGEPYRSAPEIVVHCCITMHRDNLIEATRLRDFVIETLWEMAIASGAAPAVTYIGTDAPQEARAWRSFAMLIWNPVA